MIGKGYTTNVALLLTAFRDVFGWDLRSVLSVLLFMTAVTSALLLWVGPTSTALYAALWRCTLAMVFAQLFFLFFVSSFLTA